MQYNIHYSEVMIIEMKYCLTQREGSTRSWGRGTQKLCRTFRDVQRILIGDRLQSTLVISNSKGLSEILRDIRTSTYQICRTEEKLIRLTTFNKYMCNWTLEVRDILKILRKRGEISPLSHNILVPDVRCSYLNRDQIFTSR